MNLYNNTFMNFLEEKFFVVFLRLKRKLRKDRSYVHSRMWEIPDGVAISERPKDEGIKIRTVL
jgi:hypothetical protein